MWKKGAKGSIFWIRCVALMVKISSVKKTLTKIISNGLLSAFGNAYILSVFNENAIKKITYQIFLHKTQ